MFSEAWWEVYWISSCYKITRKKNQIGNIIKLKMPDSNKIVYTSYTTDLLLNEKDVNTE